MRFFDHLVVAYFMGHPVYTACQPITITNKLIYLFVSLFI